MSLLRNAALVVILAVVVAESRYVQHPKGKTQSQREILLQTYLSKNAKKSPEEPIPHTQHKVKSSPINLNKRSDRPKHHQVPDFHPESKSGKVNPAVLKKPAQVKKQEVPIVAKPANNKVTHPLLRKLNKSKKVKKSNRKPLLTKQQEVCQTEECVSTADSLLAAMDRTADPCDDFFQFSCGNWIESHPIPPTSSSISVFNDLRNTLSDRLREILEAPKAARDSNALTAAKNLYASCMDIDSMDAAGVGPLADVLTTDYSGWPLTEDNWDPASFNPVQAYANLFTKGGVQSLHQVYILPDDMNTDTTIIYMDQASLGLPRDFFLNPDLSVILNAYRDLMLGTAKVIRDFRGSSVTDAQLEQQVDAVIAFETQIAEIMTPDEDRQNFTALYNKYTAAEFQDFIGNPPQFNWRDFFQLLFSSAGLEITDDEPLVMYAPEYATKVFESVVGTVDNKVFADYFAWRIVYAHGELTNAAMRDLFFQFDQVISGITEPPARWLTCSNLVNNMLGFAVSGPYVSQFFPPAAKDEMVELITNLRAAYDEILDTLEWMDDETKAKAKTKLEMMREFIAYPDWVLDDAAVDAFYDGVTADPATLLANAYGYNQWAWTDMAKTLHVPTNRDLWITPPSIVNAFFYPSMNSITFPAGILQPPFFQSNRLQSLNYGGIGMVIGHEMTHGFDNNGRQFDELGNLVNWWTEETGNAFIEKAQCFIDQYTGYAVPELDEIVPDAHLNGLQTLGENIADNGGMTEAWNAYLKYKEVNGPEPLLPGLEDYTPEQLFFINFGNLWCGHYTQAGLLNIVLNDEHSPGKYRVWGTASNSAAFAEAFGCTQEDNMANGDQACRIW